ncbi:MAG: hypothetical protein ACYDCN_09375 [Bacteroidia bacterium]
MKEDDKLINAVLDLGLEMKAMHKEQHKTNQLLAEHSRSIMALGDKLKVVVDHERRIAKLERAA